MEDEYKKKVTKRYLNRSENARVAGGKRRDSASLGKNYKDWKESRKDPTAKENKRREQEKKAAIDIAEAMRPEPTDKEYDPMGPVKTRASKKSENNSKKRRVISVEQQQENLLRERERDRRQNFKKK